MRSPLVARIDQVVVLAFLVFQAVAFVALNRWLAAFRGREPTSAFVMILACQVLPFVGWNYLAGLLTFVQHAHPSSIWFANREEWSFYGSQLLSTTHIILPWHGNLLFHNIMEHTAHHIDPRIPLYRLPRAQADLEAAYGDNITSERLTLAALRRTLRLCRLYDYEKHCWLDFDGTPTTQPAELLSAGQRHRQNGP
jgi:omega-6 fatty acid desaturase (delta-12 desaturase)